MKQIYGLKKYLKNLKFQKQGVWHIKTKSKISYPKEGNYSCYQIEDKSFWFIHRNNIILKSVKAFPPNTKGPIFDIGGGNGFVAKKLIENGFKVVVMEAGMTGAINAARRKIKNVICASFNDCKFKSNTIPGVGLFDVLEHIKNEKKFLKNIHTILEPNGILYLTIPAHSFLWSNVDSYSGHFRRYSLKRICENLKNAGFKIEYNSYFFWWLIIPIFIFRVMPYIIFKKSNRKRLLKREENFHLIPFAIKKLICFFNQKELKKIQNLEKIFFGASIILVARKTKK